MERVAFLVERTGQRLSALLNPEYLVMRRTAGVRSRRSVGGSLTGEGLCDDPLLFTGGGVTELTLALLFDVSVAGSTIVSEDVRDLTRPFWEMAESSADGRRTERAGPPLVTFVWGKAFTLTGVIAAVAERLEYFTADGAPRRSWMRLRMLRSAAPAPADVNTSAIAPLSNGGAGPLSLGDGGIGTSGEPEMTHVVVGGQNPIAPGDPPSASERLDELAHRHLGSAALWRSIAAFNRIADPIRLTAGNVLRIPQPSAMSRAASRPGEA